METYDPKIFAQVFAAVEVVPLEIELETGHVPVAGSSIDLTILDRVKSLSLETGQIPISGSDINFELDQNLLHVNLDPVQTMVAVGDVDFELIQAGMTGDRFLLEGDANDDGNDILILEGDEAENTLVVEP